MRRKHKTILIASLAANAILIVCLIVGYMKMSLVHEELFFEGVLYKLVELDGLIEHQKMEDWSEPNLVTTQLSIAIRGIYTATHSGEYSGWISNKDRNTMEQLAMALSQYPHDELYTFRNVTESDLKELEELQTKMQQVGIGMNMTISHDWESFIDKSEELLNLLQSE